MYKSLFGAGGILLTCAATTVFAQGRVERSFEPSPQDCSDVKWSAAVLEVYPGIASACQGVQSRDGKTYVTFEGTVDEVVDGGEQVRVDFKDGGEITLAPPRNTTLYVEGEKTSFADLRSGAELTFHIPEDRLQAEFQADSRTAASVSYIAIPILLTPTARSDRVSQTDDRGEYTAANELPATASVWPWLAAGGAALLLLGAGLTLGRTLRISARRNIH